MQRSYLSSVLFSLCAAFSFHSNASTTVTFQQGLNKYQGAFETEVFSQTRGDENNFQELTTKSDADGVNQIFIRFGDLFGNPQLGQIPNGAFILSAKLSVEVTDATQQNVEIYAIKKSWSEVLQWSSAPFSENGILTNGVQAEYDVAVLPAPVAEEGRFEFDVADTVQDWSWGVDNLGLANNGWLLQVKGSDEFKMLNSSAEQVFRPSLEITYTTETFGPIPGIDATSKFILYYGDLRKPHKEGSNAKLASDAMVANNFDLAVIHPSNSRPAVVHKLQESGMQVLGYISIGEEKGDELNGGGTGPVYFDKTSGTMVHQNNNMADYFVDANFYEDGVQDGEPDATSHGGFFVYPNARWRHILKNQRKFSPAEINDPRIVFQERADAPGLDQIALPRDDDNSLRKVDNYGFDGFFLDTMGTAGPNKYPWAARQMRKTIAYIRRNFPDKIIVANRGIHFYNPFEVNEEFNVKPYDYTPRSMINGVLFESLSMPSSGRSFSQRTIDYHMNVWAPKLNAEANRPDGFTMMALDYAAGAGEFDAVASFDHAVRQNGWVHYVTDGSGLYTVGTTVIDMLNDFEDNQAPVWTSSASASSRGVSARVGIQEAVTGPHAGEVTVRWDVAADQTGQVKYNVYVLSPEYMEFKDVPTQVGEGWSELDGPRDHQAYEYTISGLTPGVDYEFMVRAEDNSPLGLEDDNSVTLSAVASVGESRSVSFQEGIHYEGTVDTMLRSHGPDSIYSSRAKLYAADGDVSQQTLLKFENIFGDYEQLVPEGAIITSAKLTFHVYSDTRDRVSIHKLLQPWGNDATWNSFIDGVQTDGHEASLEPLYTGYGFNNGRTEYNVDITNAVRSWANGEENHGVVLFVEGRDTLRFYSAEYRRDYRRPMLTVEYQH